MYWLSVEAAEEAQAAKQIRALLPAPVAAVVAVVVSSIVKMCRLYPESMKLSLVLAVLVA